MNNSKENHLIISSLIWKLMERGGTQGIQFIVQIILARLLLPTDFGAVAIITVFITIAKVFVESGLSTALIQKKSVDNCDYSTVFYISMFLSLILYILIYTIAPAVAEYYRQPVLTNAMRVLSLTVFLGAINSIQNAFIAKNMIFKRLFISSIGAIAISGAVGIMTAYHNWGIWAIISQQLVYQIILTLILWFSVQWRPSLTFSFQRAKKLFSFGSRLLIASLINVVYSEIRTLLIGRIYNPRILGFYNRGENFPKVVVANINGAIGSVMLPAYSRSQEDTGRIKQMVRRSIVSSSFIIFPMMIGMFVVADDLINLILTKKWEEAVPFVKIFCLYYAFMPIHTANIQAINAIGRSDIFLKLEIVKKIIGIIILLISLPFGVYAIALGMVLSSVIFTFINSLPNKKLLNYSYSEQLKDILPNILITTCMGVIVSIIKYLNFSSMLTISIQVIVGVISYLLLSFIFNNESLKYLKNIYINLRR